MKIDVSVLRVPAIALITAFLAINALPQILTAPPNQSPPSGSNFSAVNQSAVTAFAGGTISLRGMTEFCG
jgi:hypothetical protein